MAEPGTRVVLSDIDIPFWRMVVILVKWTIASIPAIIIVSLIFGLLSLLFAGILGLAGVGMHEG
jgi:hypothetical protein